MITAINVGAKTVTGIIAKNHSAAAAVIAFFYDQGRSAMIADGSTGQGISAGGTYLFNGALNNAVGGWEAERSFLGELNGATGKGGNIAAEFEDSAGGPPLASGVSSGLRLFAAQSLPSKGRGTGAITSSTAGNTSVVFGSAAATNMIPPGHALQLSGSGTTETVFATTTWVPGSSATVPLASPVVNTGQTAAAWDQYNAGGPGLNGFLAHGVGIEEEALYNPVDGLYYIERAATQDAMPGANIVAESSVVFNGATFDRLRAVTGDGMAATGIAAEVAMLWNGATFDRAPGNATLGARVSQADAVTATVSASSAVNLFSLDTTGYASLSVHVTANAGFNMVTFEGSNDNATWFLVTYIPESVAQTGPASNNGQATSGSYRLPCSSKFIRARISTYLAGTTTVTYALRQNTDAAWISTFIQNASIPVTPTSNTVGGALRFRLVSAATTNSTLVAAGLHNFYGLYALNTSASIRYVKLYDKATAPTVGTDTPTRTVLLPASSAIMIDLSMPELISLGLGLGITGAATDADTTAVAAGDVILTLTYK